MLFPLTLEALPFFMTFTTNVEVSEVVVKILNFKDRKIYLYLDKLINLSFLAMDRNH